MAQFLSILESLWAQHDKIGAALTLVVLVWVGMGKDKKEALGSKLPRLAHLLDFAAAVGMNLLEAKRTLAMVKSGAPYTLPTDTPSPSQNAAVSDR
mgnify:FL=1